MLVAPKLLLGCSPVVGTEVGLGLAPLVVSTRRGDWRAGKIGPPAPMSGDATKPKKKARFRTEQVPPPRYTVAGSSASGCQTRSRARSTAISLTST
jgi:hypothetical protein